MNLVLLDPQELVGDLVTLGDGRFLHIREVLRATPGKPLQVGVLGGAKGVGRVEAITSSQVVLRCEFNQPPPPPPAVDLLLAVPRPKAMKRLWAQLAAVGVRRIVLTHAANVERFYFDSHVVTPATYLPLLREGLMQAEDTRLPEVHVARSLRLAAEKWLDPQGARLVLHPGAPRSGWSAAAARPLTLAVGPEGGWTPAEIEYLAGQGFQAVGLGPRILRTDTACITALSIVNWVELGGFGT
jgi:RsmE family RNA methyltransferase